MKLILKFRGTKDYKSMSNLNSKLVTHVRLFQKSNWALILIPNDYIFDKILVEKL